MSLGKFKIGVKGKSHSILNDILHPLRTIDDLGEDAKHYIDLVGRRADVEWVCNNPAYPPHCILPPLSVFTHGFNLKHVFDLVEEIGIGALLTVAYEAIESKYWKDGDGSWEYYKKINRFMNLLPESINDSDSIDNWANKFFDWVEGGDRKTLPKDRSLWSKIEHVAIKLGWEALLDGVGGAVNALGDMYNHTPFGIQNRLEQNWDQDDEFAFQRMNGLDPTVIRQVSADDWAAYVNAFGADFTSAMPSHAPTLAGNGQLYVTDYKLLDVIVKQLDKEQKEYDLVYASYPKTKDGKPVLKDGKPVLIKDMVPRSRKDITIIDPNTSLVDFRGAAAPIAFFSLNDDKSKLMPLAIKLTQDADAGKADVVLPSEKLHWRAAQLRCNSAQVNNHEIWSHLGRTHLTMEPVWLAGLLSMRKNHPLVELLYPTFFFTLIINALARVTLVRPNGEKSADYPMGQSNGTIQTHFMPTGPALDAFMAAQWDHLNWDHFNIKHNLSARGVDPKSMPCNLSSKDQYELWPIVETFVTKIVDLFYADNKAVQEDEEVQKWTSLLTEPKQPGNSDLLSDIGTILGGSDVTAHGLLQKIAYDIFENPVTSRIGGVLETIGSIGKAAFTSSASKGGAGFKGMPWQNKDGSGKLETKDQLIEFLTGIIFNCSAGHGMVNNGQFLYMGFIPNAPVRFQVTAKTIRDRAALTEGDLASNCPKGAAALTSLLISYALSAPTDDLLGAYGENDSKNWFEGVTAIPAIQKEYQDALKALAAKITARNGADVVLQDPTKQYFLCNPNQLAQGISI